nr:EAL domain-containing protein [Pyrinomonadaceae bacterium]
VADRVAQDLSRPFNLSGHEVVTTASIGIAPSVSGYTDPNSILRDADMAMYRAKSLGKSRYEIFDKAMHVRAVDLLQLETDLRRAIEREEFLLHYQPIVELATGAIRGFEALVRWQHPERGMVSPGEFIPLAEDTLLIIPIGEWVLRQACRQIGRWQEQAGASAPLWMSVNLSIKQFTQPNLPEQVNRILQETNLDPRNLKLEITESLMMENIETAIDMLTRLRALGIELSIDDFGTGYSSLSYLHRFPLSTLKIDRSFVSNMDESNGNTQIVRTVVTLARSLGMQVVAEGVETEEQLLLLGTLGCEYGQGYLFSPPVGVEAAGEMLNKNYSHAVKSSSPKKIALRIPDPGRHHSNFTRD